MKQHKKEELVKELYEKYPYPSRNIQDKEKLINYSHWILQIFKEKETFWKNKEILELGCGTGELANSLALNGGKILAIDFSKNSIKKAKILSKKMKTKNSTFLQKNILEFNSKKRFDVIIALGSLHHTINAKKGFEIASKHCKKNGLIIIGLYNKYSRFRHRIKRLILLLTCRNDFEKRIKVGKKLFKSNESPFWCADKYGQVHESYHSINEVLQWFKENEIEFISSKPKFKHPIFDELKWLIKKENAFFVMIGRKK
ncbi:MAG: methyltransferase domain-containing protein [Candidatus ainarchaeum sp.]|nr:methyltransferase domain-containing protein [Candidatus ainarchaeum sp.]